MFTAREKTFYAIKYDSSMTKQDNNDFIHTIWPQNMIQYIRQIPLEGLARMDAYSLLLCRNMIVVTVL